MFKEKPINTGEFEKTTNTTSPFNGVRTDQEKANLFANHLSQVFKPFPN